MRRDLKYGDCDGEIHMKDDVLDRAVRGAPAEKVPFGGDKKEQTTRAQSRMSQQRRGVG